MGTTRITKFCTNRGDGPGSRKAALAESQVGTGQGAKRQVPSFAVAHAQSVPSSADTSTAWLQQVSACLRVRRPQTRPARPAPRSRSASSAGRPAPARARQARRSRGLAVVSRRGKLRTSAAATRTRPGSQYVPAQPACPTQPAAPPRRISAQSRQQPPGNQRRSVRRPRLVPTQRQRESGLGAIASSRGVREAAGRAPRPPAPSTAASAAPSRCRRGPMVLSRSHSASSASAAASCGPPG